MAVLDMVEKVRAEWGRGNVALGVLIDLKKAFDMVDHAILLAKLEHYGVRGGLWGCWKAPWGARLSDSTKSRTIPIPIQYH